MDGHPNPEDSAAPQDEVAATDFPPPPPPPSRHRVRWTVMLIAAGVMVLGVAAALLNHAPDTASVLGAPESPSTAVLSVDTYRGHGISFRYPPGWQEFLPSDGPLDVNPAYAPDLPGHGDEYVMVSVQHDTPSKMPASMSPEAALKSIVGGGDITGPMQEGTAGGLPAYSVPWTRTGPHGQALEGVALFIQGKVGDFGLACQYEPRSKEVVMRGCNMVRDTFMEVPVGLSGGPGDCTVEQGALLDDLGLPEGARPEAPTQLPEAPDNWPLPPQQCDELVDMPQGSTTDVIGFYRSRFAEGGWEINVGPEVARMFAPGEPVVHMLATRDFDSALIEVYMKGDVVSHFFVTVGDG